MELISIIVPIYNVEQYLPLCLDSISKQTYKNIEIILVDDGSTDNSGMICDKFAEKDHRAVVIHKKNQGVTLARINGFQRSKGNFVMYIDGDDYVSDSIIETMYRDIRYYDVDMVSCQIYEENCLNTIKTPIRPQVGYYDRNRILDLLKENFLYDINLKMAGCTGYLCSRLIKREFVLESLKAGIGIIHSEDQLGILQLLYNIKSMYVESEYMYHYVRRYGQTTQLYDFKLWDNFNIYFNRIRLIDKNNYLCNQLGFRAWFILKMLIKMELNNDQLEFKRKLKNIKINYNNMVFLLFEDVNISLLSIKEKTAFLLIKYRFLITYALLFYLRKLIFPIKRI